MAASSADLDIPKYAGSADDGPVQDWFHLFEVHATAASWSERDMVKNFNDYVTGEAFRFYLTHIFQNNESWNKIREEMITRFRDYSEDSPVIHHLEKFQLCHRSPSSFPKRSRHPSDFHSARNSSFTSSLHRMTRGVTEAPDAFDSSPRIRRPPPGYPSRGSSVAPNAYQLPDKVAAFTVSELKHWENTQRPQDEPKRCLSQQGSISIVPQSCRNSQLEPDQVISAAVSPPSANAPVSRIDAEGTDVSNLTRSCESEASVMSDIAEASEELSSNDGALCTVPDNHHNRPQCAAYLVDTTSAYEENLTRVPNRSPHKQLPQHQEFQQRQQQEYHPTQQKLQQRQRRIRTSSEAHSRIEGRPKTRSLCQRNIQDVRHLPVHRQRHLLHHRKRQKRHKAINCTPQERRRRPVSFGQRTRKRKAHSVYQSRQTTRRVRHADIRSNKVIQYYSAVTYLRHVSSSVCMRRAWVCCPGRNSQPRPPELFSISPDCCTLP